ncbi:MAG: hypothetical protein ACPGO4_03645 [Flavobacteriaceae bacterium]|jgi:hypothetical protein
MKRYLTILLLFVVTSVHAQQAEEEDYSYEYLSPLNDPSAEGQMYFVEELMDLAGYAPEKIVIYQNLPNSARVFRVTLDSISGGFVFIRYDKKKKENYVANKMIDPGMYLSLKTAKEIFRQQTDKANFTKEDTAIQAADQSRITSGELQGFREEYSLQQEEKKQLEQEQKKKQRKKVAAKRARKLRRKNN